VGKPNPQSHLHLEGAIPHRVLWELLQEYGGDPDVRSSEELTRKFVYEDFSHFIQTWTWMTGLLREYDDFERIAAEVAHDLGQQNVRYAEVFYSPADFVPAGLEPQRLTEAIRRGLNQAPRVRVALVADLVRDYGAKRSAWMLQHIKEVKEFGVIGIGIGGSEHKYPPEAFAGVFEQARKLGFRTSAHAGEAAGPKSIWGAIHSLHVDRIGHGTRAIEDPRLVDYLAENRIPLELCIVSNVRTGVVPNIEAHPARTYYERGVPLSINTDDPKLFGTSLTEEYLALREHLHFSQADIERMIDQAIEASWLPKTEQQDLIQEFAAERSRR
jgi:adenosine deaminase